MLPSHTFWNVEIPVALHGNCRFEAVPVLGDWFIFEINESGQSWKVTSTMKSQNLCVSHIFNDQLEV